MTQKANSSDAEAKAKADAEAKAKAEAEAEIQALNDDDDDDDDDDDLNAEPIEASIPFEEVDAKSTYRVRLLKAHQFKGALYPEGTERTLRGSQVTRNCKVLRKL